ncbi:MAG: class I SAM-dependent methyltransferase [Zetaproteobacteria bacterium]|nr:class I SAM-dependent methyltransferase [Zetaproteobacteria bacterium]
MNITQLRGMRYPDEYLIRMFYKESMHQRTGHALELGSGTANNLMHFAAYGWKVTGNQGEMLLHDRSQGLPKLQDTFDALLIPSTFYYITQDAAWQCMRQAKKLLNLELCFICVCDCRTIIDMVVANCRRGGGWLLECEHTGENGVLNVFWHEYKLMDLVRETLGMEPTKITLLRVAYENVQNGLLVRNSDIVLWGRLP